LGKELLRVVQRGGLVALNRESDEAVMEAMPGKQTDLDK